MSWVGRARGSPCDLWLTNGIMDNGIMGAPRPIESQTDDWKRYFSAISWLGGNNFRRNISTHWANIEDSRKFATLFLWRCYSTQTMAALVHLIRCVSKMFFQVLRYLQRAEEFSLLVLMTGDSWVWDTRSRWRNLHVLNVSTLTRTFDFDFSANF